MTILRRDARKLEAHEAHRAAVKILAFQPADVERHAPALEALLQDAVANGGGIGFLAPVADDTARRYWQGVRDDVAAGHRVLLVATHDERIVASAQLELARRETGLHRAEIQKLMVHASARRRGIATALVREAEREALARGRTLIILDTFTGSDGDALYRKLGWNVVGEIPGYAKKPDGAIGALTLFWKTLA